MGSEDLPPKLDPQDIETDPVHMSSSTPWDLPTYVHAQEFMDEYLKDQDLGELDLESMEDACTRKSFESIPAWQIQLFQEVLVKAKA